MSTPTLPADVEKGVLPVTSMSTATLTDHVENGTTHFIPSAPPAGDNSKAVALPNLKPNKPPPAKRTVSRWIRWQLWFNTYRKFFTVIMIANVIAIVLATTGHWPYARKYTGAMVLGNLLFAVLMRNELFGRLLYLVINTLFAKWTPLWFRLGCTSVVQHLGGIHSACATSGLLWLIYKVTQTFIDHSSNPAAILVIGVITNLFILIVAVSAIPWIRNNFHNIFERHHRFAGWLGLMFTWVFVMITDSFDTELQKWDLTASRVVRDQQFWFVIGMTACILFPWFTVRKVPVDIELPSPKVAILRFERGMQQGLLSRVSRSAIMEYHAFGIISEGKHAKYHYLICGVQGDFTKSLVNDPPRTIWTRQLKFAGVSNTSALYTRGIRVCTGTGLGAALSTCIQSPNWYLIWIGSDQEKNFGPTISGLIHRHMGPERLCLWDSKKRVVFVTSNMQGNSEIMQGCKEANIPAFGTLWDF
ncbi:hypothetical protein JB92DRAFT_3080866 [Gautieria morchelliformis]|nr:hypothetical protein JB92DRAFT_3080866 [Gautieria morchelliformis]